MLKNIGHLGIAVKDIDRVVDSFSRILDLPRPEVRDVPEKKMKVAMLDLNGISLEFLEDYSDDGPIGKYVAEKGNGIHHIGLNTDDIEGDIRALVSRGAEMRDQKSRVGLRGKRIAFIHPDSLEGLTVELSEP